MSYRFMGCVPVNLGRWVVQHPDKGTDRGEGWREVYFHEATFNWGWLPPNSYGKFIMEMKNAVRVHGKAVEFQLAWVKAPMEIKRTPNEHFHRLEGAYFKETRYKPWELYESDYFKLPTYDKPILLYLMARGEEGSQPSVAMWTLALFEKVEG